MTMKIDRTPTLFGMGRTQETLARTRSALSQVEKEILTGRRVHRPSDDPTASTRIDSLRARRGDQTTFKGNAQWTTALLDRMEQALGESSNVMKRAQELAISMSSEFQSANVMADAADEVASLKESLLALGNAEFDGRHVFAGTAYDQAAFDATGTYQGASDQPSIQVSRARALAAGLDGSQAFQGDVDAFATLDDLVAALNAGDHVAVQWLLPPLKEAVEQFISGRTEVGGQQIAAMDAVDTAENLDLLLAEELDHLEGADPAASITKLNELQTTYEATLSMASRSMGRNLFQMLG